MQSSKTNCKECHNPFEIPLLKKYFHISVGKSAKHLVLHGRTALLTAAFEGNLKNVKNLIEKGADVNVEKKDGKTALLLASGNSNGLQIIQYLIQNGAKINAQTKDGYSPLMWAAYNGNIKIVKELLQVLNLREEFSLWFHPQKKCQIAILNFSK